jgi:CheY-like chemotaxis protein
MSQVTILVVDDDEGHVELVRRNLKRSGIGNSIVALSDGQQALDYIFRHGRYEGQAHSGNILVLLDINMPGIDGVEVLRRIKSDPKSRMIPVLMLTTTDDTRDINRCYALGCNVYITKPVDPSRFMDAIQQLGLFIAVIDTPIDPKYVA